MSSETKPLLPAPRRVVTGHNAAGGSIISSDESLILKDYKDVIRTASIWTTQNVPTQDNAANIDGATRTIPDPFGLRFPQGIVHLNTDLAPGQTTPFHRTNSVDYNILISGRLVLILDDDKRVEVQPGNVVIQRGTLHAWHNPSMDEWARWVSVLIHADPVQVDGKPLEELFPF